MIDTTLMDSEPHQKAHLWRKTRPLTTADAGRLRDRLAEQLTADGDLTPERRDTFLAGPAQRALVRVGNEGVTVLTEDGTLGATARGTV